MPKKIYRKKSFKPYMSRAPSVRYIETVRTVNSHSLKEWNELVQDNNNLRFEVTQLQEHIKKLEDFINAAMLSDSQVERKVIDLTVPPPIIDLTDEFF